MQTLRKYRTNTGFATKWGISAPNLAKEEHTTPAAIHMRVMHFGTPWQRKKKPNKSELYLGRTQFEISECLGISATAWCQRLCSQSSDRWLRPTVRDFEYRSFDLPRNSVRWYFWLHPNHPEYASERSKWYAFLDQQGVDKSHALWQV